MSLALYRKYRPGTLAEVRGQEHVTGPLRQALINGRIHHAYLFSGPRGCGKTSSARILARSLNCEKGPTPDPCGVCDSCVALAPNGPGSLDVVEIDAASHGGVDDARDLRERAFFAPVASRYKIYIIDEAHMVSREGFNALLKLVEEPPEFLRFVFATTEPEKVLGTIKSRTHHYPFRLMPRSDLTALLEDIAAQEGVPMDPSVMPLVVRAAAGSARDGLSILDQVLAGAGPEGVTREGAAQLLGVTPDTLLDDLIDAFAARDGAAVFAAVDEVMEGGLSPRRFLEDVLQRLRDLVVLAAVPDAVDKRLLDAPADQLPALSRQAQAIGAASLSRAADLFHVGLTELKGTTSPRLLLELVCARVLLPSTGDPAVLARIERLENRLEIGGVPTVSPSVTAPKPQASPAAPAAPEAPAARPAPAPAPAAPAPSAPAQQAPPVPAEPVPTGALDATALRRQWDGVLDDVNKQKKQTKALLMSAQVLALSADALTLGFASPQLARMFESGAHVDVLKDVLRTRLGLDVRVECTDGNSQAAPEEKATSYDGLAPGDEIEPTDPDVVEPTRAPSGEDAALALVQDQLGGTVLGSKPT